MPTLKVNSWLGWRKFTVNKHLLGPKVGGCARRSGGLFRPPVMPDVQVNEVEEADTAGPQGNRAERREVKR
jgi:hypothetical protein